MVCVVMCQYLTIYYTFNIFSSILPYTMNALINMYILINKVSQVALYVYIGSKAIHLWNCLFASLPESH